MLNEAKRVKERETETHRENEAIKFHKVHLTNISPYDFYSSSYYLPFRAEIEKNLLHSKGGVGGS